MSETYLFCPVEQELLGNFELDEPCEYCGAPCVECPYLMEIDEHWQEVRG